MTCAPDCDAELHRRRSDAARRAVHEQPFAGTKLRLREERVVRGRERLDESSGLRPADAVRHPHHVRVMHGGELRVATAREERHHAPAVLGLAGAFEPGDVGGAPGRRRIAPRALHQIGAVDARGSDADQDLAVAGHRVGPLLDLEATFDDYCRAHSGMLRSMKLEGVHHVTCITGDAPANVEFYAGELGLRMVKKTVNQDDPTVYHLFYADERGSAGADITFFEYPGAPKGRAGDGMVHTVVVPRRAPRSRSTSGSSASAVTRARRLARCSTIPRG